MKEELAKEKEEQDEEEKKKEVSERLLALMDRVFDVIAKCCCHRTQGTFWG